MKTAAFMFKIGEFAQIARVTRRQLRHYDHLGLLAPAETEPATGYRYYSAAQLPRLNRILALQGLGFSLDQIGRIIDGDVSAEELRGMLTMRKLQVEQALIGEQNKLRQIESRILQIEEQGGMRDYDVAVKAVAAQPFLSMRRSFDGVGEVRAMMRELVRTGLKKLHPDSRCEFAIIVYSDFENERLDLELGVILARRDNEKLRINDEIALSLRELEPADAKVSIVRAGPIHESHLAYGALGIWMEANNYEISGLCREVFIQTPIENPINDDAVIEIQFPVTKRGAG